MSQMNLLIFRQKRKVQNWAKIRPLPNVNLDKIRQKERAVLSEDLTALPVEPTIITDSTYYLSRSAIRSPV